MARLGDICAVVSGTTPKSTQPEYWDGNLNWVTPAELTDESDVIYESQRKITPQAVIDSSLKPFPAGTVLLSSRAPIGKVAITGTEMFCNQQVGGSNPSTSSMRETPVNHVFMRVCRRFAFYIFFVVWQGLRWTLLRGYYGFLPLSNLVYSL